MSEHEYEQGTFQIQTLGDRSGTLAVQCYRQLGNGRHTGHLATTEHVPRPLQGALPRKGSSRPVEPHRRDASHLGSPRDTLAPTTNDREGDVSTIIARDYYAPYEVKSG